MSAHVPRWSQQGYSLTRVGSLSSEAVLRGFIWSAVVIGCYILAHRYAGIFHDNILYLGQALFHINPSIYGGDVFFEFGSQDRYTLFSPVYSRLITHLGLSNTNIILVLLAQGLFLAASYALVRALIPTGVRGFAMVFVVTTVGLYGGRHVFRMAEPFITPRPFVEVATLLALALLLSGRRASAFTVLFVGALLHPLVAIAGMAFCWFYLTLEDRRWGWLLALGVIPIVAGVAGVAPFTQLFQTFDNRWLGILLENNSHLFVTQWTHFDWGMIAFDVAVLLIGAHFADGKTRRVFKTALVAAMVTVGLTFLFADILHNVLLTSIQPWRTLWIVHWMAAAAVPFVAWHMWKENQVGRLIVALLVFGFVTRGLSTSFAASVVAIALFYFRSRVTITPWIARSAIYALAAGALANWIAAGVYWFVPEPELVAQLAMRMLSKPLPLLVFAGTMIWLGTSSRRNMGPASIVAAVFVCLAALGWDQRSSFSAYIESATPGAHPFSRIVQPHQQVLWHGTVAAPWALMQRKSFHSGAQQAGQIFNRETAVELQRRKEAIAILELQAEICQMMNALNRTNDSCQPDADAVRDVCREARNLDFIVLKTPIANRWTAAWRWSHKPAVRGPQQNYYLYDCKNFI